MQIDTEHFKKELNRVLDNIVIKIFEKSQQNLITTNPDVSKHPISDTGMLLGSGKFFLNPDEKIIRYSAPYAKFVEFGTQPHYISPERLYKWVGKKLGLRGPAVKKVAFNIAQKISIEGTDPKPFLRSAMKQVLYEES